MSSGVWRNTQLCVAPHPWPPQALALLPDPAWVSLSLRKAGSLVCALVIYFFSSAQHLWEENILVPILQTED